MVVLIVDDDAVSRLVIEHILQAGDHATVAVESAEDALAHLAATSTPIDIIVCDYLMPGASGLDLLEQLSANRQFTTPPFVLLTGISDAADLEDPRVDDVSGYLTKPVKSTELLAVVEALVGAQ